ncbi:hypothetical protein QBC38DRAFT_156417 [Podospora fimiseda]|uniref:Gag1-like clamp domain-containing protein n=1 Tax=Podospora fimiseda TaxID=252190 RepID=A0AAN7H5J6_9PEZI|nr:hypothetical protein QBC38DRAFT_156417 [Podospora fimiseda]
MIFSDLYKSPRSAFSKLRSHSNPPLPSDIDVDLLSKDKTKSKEAVRRFLAEKVRNDWAFEWPSVVTVPPVKDVKEEDSAPAETAPPADGPTSETVPGPTATSNDSNVVDNHEDDAAAKDSGEEADSESDAESIYSTISEDPLHFQPRLEWTSDLSDDEIPHPQASPFRFDSPDDVGNAVRCSIESKRTKRRRALREEATWNPGLACFEARRNAWTGAKTCRVKPKSPSPVSPTSTRRIFWRHHRTESSSTSQMMSPSSPPTSPLDQSAIRTSQQTDMSTITPPISETDSSSAGASNEPSSQQQTLYPVQTLVPVPAPLLPPQNAMRSSITPSIYPSLYDKLVVQGLTPTCPVNLSDMLRACVVGWKRDGEWPPRSTYPVPPIPAASLLAPSTRQQQRKSRPSVAAAAASSSTPSSTVRRLSFGFLGGKAEGEQLQQHNSNGSDESGGGAGKALRRSLQRVLSLGGHGDKHHQPQSPTAAAAQQNGNGKEATVAGMAAALV